jgi:hypothetical protein
VTCSRCHRNIPERELASHMLTHKSKVHRFPSTPKAGPEPARPASTSAISLEEFSRRMLASRPQKSNLSSEQVKGVFEQILKEMTLPISSLKVGVKRRVQAEVVFDAQRNVELYYDDNYLRTLDGGEIKATLSHEACHIATVPDSNVVVVSNTKTVDPSDPFQSMQISFIELYDEFLAHKDFAQRFRGSDTFALYDRIKGRDFNNYSIILKSARTGWADATNAFILILNDAIYFPVIGDTRFLKWCKESGVLSLSLLLDWLVDDFKFIEGLNLERMETMRTVVQEGILSIGVDPATMLAEDRIAFVSSAAEAENLTETKNRELADRWRKRRLSISGNQS